MLRIQLVNNLIGSKVLEIADPIDINSLTQTYKRSEEADGLFYEIVFDLEFIKDGRDFIWAAYETDAGIDTVVLVNLYEMNPNIRKWVLVGTGQVDYNRFDLGEIDVVVNIEQTGIERRVMNMKEIDVDLETLKSENGTALPAQSVHNITYHSKKLLLQFKGEGTQEETTINIGGGFSEKYIQFPFNATFDEIEERQDYPLGQSEFIPMNIKKYNWRVKVGGAYKINISQLTALITKINLVPEDNWNWQFVYRLTYGRQGNYTSVDLYNVLQSVQLTFNVNVSLNTTINLNPGDEIYLYGILFSPFTMDANFRNYTFDGPSVLRHVVAVDAETLFPETTVRTVLLYEAIERCLQYYTNQAANVFKSSLLGRTDIGYAIDGKYSLIGITNGHRLRQKNIILPAGQRGDNLFANLEDLIQFVKVIANADFGFELDASGNKIFILEEKSYFYKKDVMAVSLGRVYDIRRRIDSKRFYNQVEIGYTEEVDVKQYNAVDEFNTKRKFQIPITNTNGKLVLLTEMITSGYLIESQRRLKLSTEDGKYDDRNFAVVMKRDAATYKPKKNEDYLEINNILFADTGYNYDLSPARILKNWLSFLASGLIRSRSKTIKFTFGTVNYIMTTKKTGEAQVTAENGDVIIASEAIWDNENYNFNHPVTREQMTLIKNNPYGYIEFQDKDGNIMQGFISREGIEYDHNRKTAEFNLLKVYRP